MEESPEVAGAIARFYERFSAADPASFAQIISDCDGVSVVGSAPGEGHNDRATWLRAYTLGIAGSGVTLQGSAPRGWSEGTVGWGRDTPAFVLPDGRRLPTRLTAVLRQEDGDWKIVHLHFSVGVPDEEALEPA
jgi:SnoaL-like protein